ncbi:PRC and DUF2382 domain-containing protein [Agrococcus sp. HG114]|uniref:PRC and DUF2382 domain-containing protein n=1 Tax=Agrococcus sp. HG114 TaxID=2969757 RepID=UPI00215B33D4|nr:PRC and DUF2382 domain-containing protein [Agrococcus sp. HG114]MCR8670525.1 PRC and DUF2382 domain-containing protein [Agrococcus sp. HG114]
MSNGNLTIEQVQVSTVYDSTGDKVGRVTNVYVDDSTGAPAFATVATGWFGTRETFVPLRDATVRGGELHVPHTKDIIKDAPNLDADAHLSEAEEAELFRYYDYSGVGTGGWGTGTTDRDRTLDRDRDTLDRGGDLLDTDRDTLDRDRDTLAGDRDAFDRDRIGDDDRETMVRREEHLDVGTERVQTGRLRIRKHVVTENETVTVPVEREEVEIVREPVSGRSTGDLGDDEIDVTLTEERPVVDKHVVDAERIGVDRRTVSDTETVSADVSREEVDIDRDIDRDGDIRR